MKEDNEPVIALLCITASILVAVLAFCYTIYGYANVEPESIKLGLKVLAVALFNLWGYKQAMDY